MTEQPKQRSRIKQFLHDLRRSRKDEYIGGVCGGLGQYTDIPAWVYRAVFLTSFLTLGIGIIPYIVLWICIPAEGLILDLD